MVKGVKGSSALRLPFWWLITCCWSALDETRELLFVADCDRSGSGKIRETLVLDSMVDPQTGDDKRMRVQNMPQASKPLGETHSRSRSGNPAFLKSSDLRPFNALNGWPST